MGVLFSSVKLSLIGRECFLILGKEDANNGKKVKRYTTILEQRMNL
jgi:hypothetical protein